MSGTITRIGATGAGALLALALLAPAPAGATAGDRDGKSDRRHHAACFDDEGRTQGRSHSDPDGIGNGGFDKPGCTGGIDADRDGNNGCGNDTDREDDNNGNCGKKPKGDRGIGNGEGAGSTTTTSTSTTTTTTTTMPVEETVSGAGTTGETGIPAAGADSDATNPAGTTAGTTDSVGTAADDTSVGSVGAANEPGTEVLGVSLERPGTLARTGAGLGGLALLGGLLCGGGRVALLARRLLRIG